MSIPALANKSSTRGQLAVALMIAVGCLAAGFSWWWNWQRTQKCLALYGGEGASLIRTAPQVDVFALGRSGAGPSGLSLMVASQTFDIAGKHDLSEAKGLIHARTALLDDHSYEWDKLPDDCSPTIGHAVRFRRGDAQITLAFDFDCRRLWHVETGRSAALESKIATGWKSFIARNIDSSPARASITKPASPH